MALLGFAAVATYTALLLKEDQYKAFAKVGDVVSRRSFQVECSDDYGKKFMECIPRRCGRVVMDDILAADDVDRLLRLPKARDIFTRRDFAAIARVRSTIQLRITLEFGANPNMLFPTNPMTITRITPDSSTPAHDEYWHPHVDREIHGTWYYSSIVDLGTYGEDFSGGRFVLLDSDANRTVEPRKGRMSLFTSGSENRQYVERVNGGERYFVTVAFTCEPNAAAPDPSLQNLKSAI